MTERPAREALDAIRARHTPVWDPMRLCSYCRDDWPCDAAVLLDALAEPEVAAPSSSSIDPGPILPILWEEPER
jgi:hypothetical protein